MTTSTIPLAPLQWAIWEALKEADSLKKLVSYRKLAQAANASIRGVRDALIVLEKEGGVRSKITVRTPDEQGMRIELNTLKPFRPASLKETKGLLKREGNYRQTVCVCLLVLVTDATQSKSKSGCGRQRSVRRGFQVSVDSDMSCCFFCMKVGKVPVHFFNDARRSTPHSKRQPIDIKTCASCLHLPLRTPHFEVTDPT